MLEHQNEYQDEPEVTDEDRSFALFKTASVFRILSEACKELSIPLDHIPVMYRAYERFEHEASSARLTKMHNARVIENLAREALPIRSCEGNRCSKHVGATGMVEARKLLNDRCPPGAVVQVVAVAQRAAYQIDQFQILAPQEHWRVHDITIGNRSQFAQVARGINGIAFGPHGILRDIKFEPMFSGMELIVAVEYIGPNPEGMPFEASALGTSRRA